MLTSTEKDMVKELLTDSSSTINKTVKQIDESELSIVPGGSVNVNYKASFPKSSPLFVKRQVTNQQFYTDSLEREYDVLRILSQIENINVPSPLYYDQNRKMLITSFIEGKAVTKKDPKTLHNIGKYLDSLRNTPISLLKRLYTGRRISPRSYWLKEVKPKIMELQCSLLPSGSNYLFEFLNEIIKSLDFALRTEPREYHLDWDDFEKNREKYAWVTLVHNDFAFRNLILSENELFAVDWEFADCGDIAFDIASLLTENFISETEAQKILMNINVTTEQKNRIMLNVRRFIPILELANTFWTIDFVSKKFKGDLTEIRSPYTINENLSYIRYNLQQLTSQFALEQTYPLLNSLFSELQTALKLFQVNILLEGNNSST